MPTLPQPAKRRRRQPDSSGPPLSRKMQVYLTEEAHLRIRVSAAAEDKPPGRLISELATEYLPAVMEGV